MTKFHEISEDAWTPKYTLNKVNEIVDNVDHIAIAIKNKDGTTSLFTSVMDVEDFALLVKRLEIRLHYVIFEGLIETQCPDGEGDVIV